MLKATTTTTKNTNINTNKNNKRKTNISKNTDTYTSAKNTTNNQATHGIFLLLLLCNCFHLNDAPGYYIYIIIIYILYIYTCKAVIIFYYSICLLFVSHVLFYWNLGDISYFLLISFLNSKLIRSLHRYALEHSSIFCNFLSTSLPFSALRA